MTIRVRAATTDDGPALRALVLAANAEFRSVVPPGVFDRYVDSVVTLVAGDARPDGVLVAVDEDDRVLGTATVVADGSSLHVEWPAGDVVLRGMAVPPVGRGLGVGMVLGRACVDHAVRSGATGIGLHTGPFMTAAQRLYDRLGFVRSPAQDVAIDRIFGPAEEPYDDVALAYRLDLRTRQP